MEKEVKLWIKTIVVSLILSAIIMNFFSFYIVSGDSMLPSIKDKEYLIIFKNKSINYDYNDIIVFNTDIISKRGIKKDLLKRIIAKEGQHIKIEDKSVYIDKKEVNENYILNKNTFGDVDIIIPKANYFVMGDNREVSLDSRNNKVGLVSRDKIIGKVIFKLFPFKSIGVDTNEKIQN